ncbi:MAG: FKBP-type peptidyl-prolyl cis-trans isomerase [Gammaproteobacteria bacterium]|nr:FKBP-type peptidyl-prolyl cis-trans isomerase [Gammaproteobacteria bacterium]
MSGQSSNQTEADMPAKLETLESKVSYLIGFNQANSLKQQGVELDVEAFTAGMRDQDSGTDSRIPESDAEAVFGEYQQKLMAAAQEKQAAAGATNRAASEAFLAENQNKEGVMTTASGLQYKVLTEGTGPKPTPQSTVSVHYTGRLVDGTVFDSSVERGTPAEFGVTQVIPGWTEALQLMNEGSKWEIYLPSDLAYGENAPPAIGPNQALIFEVELLKANAGGEAAE